MNGLMSDLRYTLRSLRGSPAFSVTVLLTIALGIGGIAAIVSFVDGVLLRPLGFPDADRLVAVCEIDPGHSRDWCGASPNNLADWRQQTDSFEALGLARGWRFGLRGSERTIGVAGGIASTGFFEVLGVDAAHGRLLGEGDSEPGRERVAVASWDLWQGQLGGDPDALGRPLVLDGESYALVGVLPPGFEVPGLESVQLWIPLWPESPWRANYRRWRGFRPFGRLAEGVSIETAQRALDTVAARLAAEYPDTNAGWTVRVESLRDRLVGDVRPALLVFLGAVGMVMLVGCANIASLTLARSTVRWRELAVRASLGANSARLLRQIFTESLFLAILGGAAGLALGGLLTEIFRNLAPIGFPRLEEVQLQSTAIAVSTGVALVAGLLFALPAALAIRRASLHSGLSDGRSTTPSRSARRWRSVLVGGEVAVALVLATAAALLARSFADLADWQPGFDRRDLLTVQIFPNEDAVPSPAELVAYYDRIADEIATLPEIAAVGLASAGPLFGGDGPQEVWVEGEPVPPEGHRPTADWYDVGPRYFETLGVPLLSGRGFDRHDSLDTHPVAIVNRTLAEQLWPGRSPLGTRLHLVIHEAVVEIVGVVEDTLPLRSDQRPRGEVYWPYGQRPRGAVHLVLRHTGAPAAAAATAVRARLSAIDPDLDALSFQSMDQHLDRQLVQPRFTAALVGGFAALALLMAAIGTYGLVAFAVARRRAEIGVRMALGASPNRIWTGIAGDGLRLALGGVAGGVIAALATTRMLRSLLVGVSPTDPTTFAGSALLLLVVAALASALPARRAARIDPTLTLRQE